MKNPALKKKRNWRNILTYIATYIVVTFSVAFVVVSFSNKTYSAGNTELKPNNAASSALGMVVTHLMEMEDANLVLNVSADRGEDEIKLDANVNLVMYPGLTGAEVNVDASLNYNDTKFNIGLTYKEGMAYVSIGDKNYSMSASSIMLATMSVLSLCGVDIDLSGDLMSSFDMSMLDSLGEIKEEKLDNGTKLSIGIGDTINVVIITDKNYNIKDVNLDRITFSGMNVGAAVVFNSTNKGTKVNVPDKEFVDVSESVGLIESLYNTVAGKKIGFNFDAFDSKVSVALDLEKNSMQAVVNALDNDFALTLKDNTIYLDAGVLKLKSNLPKLDLQKLTGVVGSLTDEQSDKIMSVLTKAYDAIKNIRLKNITKTEYGYAVKFNDTLLKFRVVDGKVNSIEINDTYTIDLFSDVQISVADENFTNVTNFEFLLQPVKSLLNDKQFSANVELNAKEFNLNGTLSVDFKDSKVVQFKSQVMGVDIMLTVTTDGVYVKVDDIKVMTDFASINNVLDELKSSSNTDLNDTIQKVLKKSIEFVKPSATQLDVKYGDYTVSVIADAGKFESIVIIGDRLNANVKFADEFTIEKNFDGYERIDITKEKIESIKNAVAGKIYSFDGTVNIGNTAIDIDATADLTDLKNIKAEAKIVAFDKTIEVNIQDNTIYIKLDGIKISGSFDEIAELVSAVMDRINGTDTYSLEVPSGLKLNDLHFRKVDDEIIVSLNVNESTISAVLNLTDLSLDVNAGDVSASVTVDKAEEVSTLSPAETSEYVAQATRLYDLAISALNTAKSEKVHAIATLNIAGEIIEVELGMIHNEKITLKFETTFKGIHVVGYVADNKVYINVFDICFMFDLNNLDKNLNQLSKIFDIDLNTTKDIATIIDTIKLNNITKFETDKNSFKLSYKDIALKVYTYSELISRVQVNYKDIHANLSITYPSDYTIEVNNNRIIELDNLAPVGNAFYNTFKSRSISGDIDLTFDLFNETNRITINYGIKIGENLTDISGYIKTTFKNLDINIYYIDKTFYLDVIGLKLKLKFDDIPSLVDWINENFDTNINVDKLFEEFKIEDFSLDFITNAHFGDDTVTATLMDNIQIKAEYTDVFNKVTFENGSTKAVLNCTRFDDFTLNSIDTADYDNYTVITDIVDALYNTAKLRQFNIVSNSKVFRNNADYLNIDLNLALDIIESTLNGTKSIALNAGGNARVSGEKNVALDLSYQNEKLYANWEGLKLSIHKNSIKEILGIVLQVLNVDTSGIPALEKIKKEFDIDTDNLGQIVPTLSSINPLNYLEYIKGINVDNGKLQLVMNGQKLNGDPEFNPVITFIMAGGKLSSVEIEKLYTGVTADENITVNVELKEFVGVPQVNDSDYIDISESASLIRAFVNTSNLNDYTISGTVNVNATIIGINIPITVDVNALVKIIDGKPVFAVEILDIPVLTGVNYDSYEAPDSVVQLPNHRDLFIYYKDGYFYIHRTEKISRYLSYYPYEKKVMVNSTDFLKNITYYLLKFGFGFSDSIMDAVDDALSLTLNRENPINKSNVLKGFSRNGDTYSVVVNMAEIANNSQLDKATINITTINNASTNDKDYIGKLAFDLYMPLASAVTMTLKTDNLTLNNIGQEIDVNGDNILHKGLEFIKNYTNYDRQELVNRDNGGWTQTSAVNYTITFDSCGGGNVNAITAQAQQPISLPYLSERVIDNGITKVSYTFAGWFTSKGYEPHTQYTDNKMCKGNITLYAKWNEKTEYYRTISFDTLGKGSAADIKDLEGKTITLPTLADYLSKTETAMTTYAFVGWFDADGTQYTNITLGGSDIKLYAQWEVKSVVEIKTLTLKHGDQVLDEYKFGVGENIVINNSNVKSTTKFYLDSSFNTEYTLASMPDGDLTLYIRNQYTITFNVNGGNAVSSITAYEGEVVTLPSATRDTTGSYKGYVASKVKYRWIITTYTFAGWTLNGEKCTSVTVPSGDVTLTANWTSSDSEEFVKLSVHNSYKKKYGA